MHLDALNSHKHQIPEHATLRHSPLVDGILVHHHVEDLLQKNTNPFLPLTLGAGGANLKLWRG